MSSSTTSGSQGSSSSSTATITPNTSFSSGHDNIHIIKSWSGDISRCLLSYEAETLLRFTHEAPLIVKKAVGEYLMRLTVYPTSPRALTWCRYRLELLGTIVDNSNDNDVAVDASADMVSNLSQSITRDNADIPSLLNRIQDVEFSAYELFRIWGQTSSINLDDCWSLWVAADDIVQVVVEDIEGELG